MAMDLDDVKTGNGNGERRPSVGDLCQVFKFPEKKWVAVRLLKGMASEAGYWVKTKKKDGKLTKFYTPCPSYDPATQQRDSTRPDPWRDLQQAQQGAEVDRDDQLVQFGSHFWINAIIRGEQKKQPSKLPKPTKAEAKSGFKDKESDSWTPVFAVKMGKSFAGKVKELKGLNTVESKKTGAVKSFSVNDEVFGRDIRVLYDSSKAPADQYQIQLGDKRTPLTEEEQAYLTWDLEAATAAEVDDKAVKADYDNWARRMGVKITLDNDSDDDDEEDDTPKKKKSKPEKTSKKSKKPVDEDEDDFDADEDEDEDDEDMGSHKKSVKKTKPVKKSKDEDEDEDDDFDDEDSEDDEEDDEEDEKPAKKSKKVIDEDEDDEDDFDEDDEDDEDEPAPKKSKKSKKVIDEDDEDDFDEDEDEDEDDEEPAPKKKSKKAKSVKSKKVVDEDEDDDF